MNNLNEFHNVKIMPYSELLDKPSGLSTHKGGPVWPQWDQEINCRHLRGMVPDDAKPVFLENTTFEIIEEPLFWCGPIVSHFGHQITDFSSRIASYPIEKEDFMYCFAVHPRDGIVSVNDTPIFFREILLWFNIPLTRVKIVSKPSIALTLVCAHQQDQLWGATPSKIYLDNLDAIVSRNFNVLDKNKSGIYYVSRAALKRGSIAGEAYLEYILGLNGVKVIRPENISLHEQLRIYYVAKKIVFLEGSAVHTIQLLGRNIGEVFIINRRPNAKIAFHSLINRCQSLQYLECGEIVHGLNITGTPAPEYGITIPQKSKLLDIFSKIGVKISGFNDNLFAQHIKESIISWREFEKNSPRANIPGSKELISEKLISLGLKDILQDDSFMDTPDGVYQ